MKQPRTPEELERIRERIIEAALAIIVEEGFSCLTMRRLASRLHMSAPNLYNFFRSKEEIYISIVIKGFQMLYDELALASGSSTGAAGKAHAMLDAYVRFGMTNKSYYDIMFTLPAPKYNDYVGTPHEKLSEVEYKISMDIARIATDTLRDLRGAGFRGSEEDVLHDVVKIWSMLHGMVSLANSNIIGYVASDIEKTHSRIIDELIDQYLN